MVFWIFASAILPLVKASILCLLLRIGQILPAVRKSVWALLVFNAIAGIIPEGFILFQCPELPDSTWKSRTFGNLHCVDRFSLGRLFIFQVSVNMLTDLLVFPIPVYFAWCLRHADIKSRLWVIFLFSLSLA